MGFLDDLKNIFNNKINTEIQTKTLHKICKDNNNFHARLIDNKNNALSNKKIQFLINGVNYEKTTDENGIASLGIQLDIGLYPIDIFFDGDEKYKPSKDRNIVHVNPKITTSDLNMKELDGSNFNAKVTDINNNPIIGIDTTFTVNGRQYKKPTNTNGIAQLNIKLLKGTYDIKTTVLETVTTNKIFIKEQEKQSTRMEGTDVTMTVNDGSHYQCAVYDNKGRVAGNVKITVNGVTYTKTPDNTGLYKLNINLQPGTYTIKSEYLGDNTHKPSSITNTIKIKSAPKCKNPYSSSPYHTSPGGGFLGQKTGYSCGPHALMQSFYNLTGIDVKETVLMDVCGTTTNGTSHQGLATGLAYLNRKYNTNITMEWKNFSDIGYKQLGELLCDKNSTIFWHELYRNKWGHYSLGNKINTATELFNILNSLGNKCSPPAYCGYQESRKFATQKSYWSGINQPSICILRKR